MTDAPGRTPGPSSAPSSGPGAPTGGAHVRAALRRALRLLVVFLVVLAAVGTGLGWLVAGTPGVWGALIGVGVTLLVCGTTVATMLATAEAPVSTTAAVVLGSWLAKMVVVVGVLVALNGRDLVDRTTLGVVVLVGVLGSAYLDYLAVSAARVPYVVPLDREVGPAGTSAQVDGPYDPRPDAPGTDDPGPRSAG